MDLSLEQKIEAILFWSAEPHTHADLAKLCGVSEGTVAEAVSKLGETLRERGVSLVQTGASCELRTAPEAYGLINELRRESVSREIGKAGLETLTVILYHTPVSRRDIEYIRGVNATFAIRNLSMRGLIERTNIKGERGYAYRPTSEALAFLGVAKAEDLPDFATIHKTFQELRDNRLKSDSVEAEHV